MKYVFAGIFFFCNISSAAVIQCQPKPGQEDALVTAFHIYKISESGSIQIWHPQTGWGRDLCEGTNNNCEKSSDKYVMDGVFGAWTIWRLSRRTGKLETGWRDGRDDVVRYAQCDIIEEPELNASKF